MLLKIKDSVDVYIKEKDDSFCVVQFYKINTRQRYVVEISREILDILPLLCGEYTIEQISQKHSINLDSLEVFVDFLLTNGLLVNMEADMCRSEYSDRFARQIAYFEDLTNYRNGVEAQKVLANNHVVIFGAGSVGSAIAIELIRMGVRHITLIDYKRLDQSHKIKHLYCNNLNLGQKKVDALKEYLLKINQCITVEVFHEKILPDTDLTKFIHNKTSLVVNSADEPYIGHLSVKIGRFLWDKNIALYIAGGFNAHSMSTGEIIVPNITPCIDCYTNSFKIALGNWKPKYKTITSTHRDKDIILGGPGSISACSLFSASYACMCIVYYLLGVDFPMEKRGEYLINSGFITWINLGRSKNAECQTCSK